MTAQELREKYFDFFKQKGHALIPSAPLIPENDPTVLFTTAGMHPLVPFLLGEKHPAGKRLVSVQKCIRTGDIDEVGDDFHLTFFEMLGNWSLGDYFKKEAIEWSFEFLTDKEWLGLDINKLAVSVFEGDSDAPFDEEAYNAWKNLGISEKRIAKLPKKNNWWEMASGGPCGPDSEMFYWVGKGDVPESFDSENNRWVEIWNDVFMQYNKQLTERGKDKLSQGLELLPDDFYYEPLKQKNVDTGMGLERTLAVINNLHDVYETELFQPIIQKIEELSGKKYEDNKKSFRILTDHIKASVFLALEGIVPSNIERGYVLRRLIRRAIRHGFMIGLKEAGFAWALSQKVIEIYGDVYPELKSKENSIRETLFTEEEKFSKTLENGLNELKRMENSTLAGHIELENKPIGISGYSGFDLYQSYGFPKEMTREETKKVTENFDVEFDEAAKRHQELSRTASVGMFKAGLADNSEIAIKYHTATHLLHKALQIVLGGHIAQKGSNITAERLRFDFSHSQKMTAEEIKKVEDIVNDKIKQALPVVMKEMTLEQAKKIGATALFAEKYGDKVKVYSIGDFSKEVCGGPHVQNTSELGHFKIIKEGAVSAGAHRIKAVLG